MGGREIKVMTYQNESRTCNTTLLTKQPLYQLLTSLVTE